MKKSTKTLLTFAAIGVGVYLLTRKSKALSGLGAVDQQCVPQNGWWLTLNAPTNGSAEFHAGYRPQALSGLGVVKARAQRQAERIAARAAKQAAKQRAFAQPAQPAPSLTQAIPATTVDARWAQIGGVALVRTPYVTVPTPASLTVDGIAQYPNGYYKELGHVVLKPGVAPLDYINAKTWAERNYRPVSGSEAMLVQSIQALS